MKERLEAADYRFILVCLALLGAAVWYSAQNFYRAFPEASIDFRVSREDAAKRAQSFLTAQGYRIEGYRGASSFSYDDDAKTFLEREAGLEKANQLMGTRVHLWRWAFRWFRPQQKEEFRADITPTGDFAGFDHIIAEDTARPDISAAEARSRAEEFLRTRAHRDPEALDFVETATVTRPHRTDRTFTWKERDFNIHDGSYRVDVTLLGDEVGGYSEYLKVPEQWTRDYDRLRSKNNAAGTVDLAVTFGLGIGLLVVLAKSVRRQDVRWRRAALIGVVGMALSVLSSLNEFPLAEYGYPTTDGYPSFVIQKLLQAVLGALAWGGALFIMAAGAEVLYRQTFPGKISVGNLFSRRGLRTKRFFLGAILGVTLCAIFLAYQTVFYIVANKLGAWSPADVPYSDLLNTRFPWLYVLLGGYLPAVSEEFVFRMFAIPFLRKLLGWMPAAIVLAGFIWGFGHATYPNQPFFIRGLEVGIGGIALGLIMLRWGILPTLIWHYSVDAMYSAMLLLRSHSLYFRLSGAASAGIFVMPIAIALVAYWRSGGFEPAAGLLNGDEPAAIEPIPASERATVHVLDYWPLSGRMRALALAIFVIGLAVAFIPVAHFGDSPVYKLSADQARAPADAFLRGLDTEPEAYRHVTYPETHWGGNDTLTAKYFLEHLPLNAVSRLFEKYRPVRYWATRYFKPLEKDEFLVTVHPQTGMVMGFVHEIPEDRAGADLEPDAARKIAAAFAVSHGLDVNGMDLQESQSEKHKARRDYSLVWESHAGDTRNVAEARYRVEVAVDGDRPSQLFAHWKIPEAFERNRERKNLLAIAILSLRMAVTVGGIVFGLWILIRQVRLGLVPWRRTLQLAAIPALMTAMVAALAFQSHLYQGYDTSTPFDTAVMNAAVGLVMQVAFAYLLYGAAAALVLSLFPESLTAFRAVRRLLAVDALVLLLLAAGLWQFCQRLAAVVTDRFHALAFVDVSDQALVGLPAPALIALAQAVQAIFTGAALLALAVLAVRMLPKHWMPVLVLATACAMVSDEVRTPGEFAVEFLPALLGVVCALAFCFWFARRNYLVYLLLFAIGPLYAPVAEFFHSGNTGLEAQGWIVVTLVLAGLVWALAPGLRGHRRPA
jgi:membrane protease YdiL (CAAX protease family)